MSADHDAFLWEMYLVNAGFTLFALMLGASNGDERPVWVRMAGNLSPRNAQLVWTIASLPRAGRFVWSDTPLLHSSRSSISSAEHRYSS
jgi:hypothetical protein